jgi:signal transduction histidine kinase
LIVSRSRKAPLPVMIGFLLLLVCAASAMWLSWQQKVAEGWVRHTMEVESRLSQAHILTMRADINRRGYLLTGNEKNIRAYLAARRDAFLQLDALASAVSDNQHQERRTQLLRASVAAKLDEMRQSIGLYQLGQHRAARMTVATPASEAQTSRLLSVLDAMQKDEIRLLAQRRGRSDRLEAFAAASLGLSALLILGLALLVGREHRLRLIVLAEANELLESDMAKREILEGQLKSARERAEEAAAAKSSFLANMSHEIRTPMNGVIGFTELLLASDLSVQQRRQAELIADSGRAMMRLLNDILDLSKIEAGQMRVIEETFDLRHALRACVRLVTPAVEQKGLNLTVEVSAALPTMICGDGLRLRQIILNLLGNAAKFTPCGSITQRARPMESDGDSSTLCIEVEDTGIGIAPDRRAAIFETFVQAEASTASRFGGTGLGLPISARLAELMGGRLVLDDEIGGGSRFVLTLPLVPSAADGAAGLDKVTSKAPPITAPIPLISRPAGADDPLRVLVAEDHDVNQLLISAMLQQLGCHAEVATNGAVAIDMINTPVTRASRTMPY